MLTTDTSTQRQRLWLCAITLGALVLVAFWNVIHAEFQIYDDWDYVLTNDVVRQGLSWNGILWAFKKFHASNWHPLTWISHMLDVSIYGLKPMGHHLTNLVLHASNTVLVFLLLNRMTASIWRSAIVAALFALHPTHVESVAWVAERKDVLSTFFGLLCLIAYSSYARSQSSILHPRSATAIPLDSRPSPLAFLTAPRYWLAVAFFALGLMSKPMLVTWPFVMLLLDIWPLNRLNLSTIRNQLSTLRSLLVEKIPFFALTVASCVLTFFAQKAGGAVQTMDQLPLLVRVGNASVSYMRYIGKTFWPVDLSIFYPYPDAWPPLLVGLSVLSLLVLVAVGIWQIRTRPYIAVGLFWFIGTLVPVIGIVQVGSQSMADRYQYIPQIGLFMGLVWGVATLAVRRELRNIVVGMSVVCVAGCLAMTRQRVEDWQDSERLFTQALRVTKSNFVAHNNLGLHRLNVKKYDEAINSFNAALAVKPGYAATHNNLALAYMAVGRVDDALKSFEDALKYSPALYQARVNLASIFTTKNRLNDALKLLEDHQVEIEEYPEGLCALANLMMEFGRLDEATKHAQAALAIRPDYGDAHNCIGSIAMKKGQPEEALKSYKIALAQNPNAAVVRRNSALALAALGRFPESILEYKEATRLKPDYLPAHLGLAIVYQESGDLESGAKHWNEVLKLSPDLWAAHEQMAMLLTKQGKYEDSIPHFVQALKHQTNNFTLSSGYALALDQLGQSAKAVEAYRIAIRIQPELPEVLNNLAWILAASGDDTLRDGAEATRHAEEACRLTDFKEARFIGTLAAAYAEAGRFDDAVKTAQRAIEQANASKQPEIAVRNAELLEVYRARKPYHEPAPVDR
jgi:tetratricopeptide (TPR) repeat protein